MRTRIELAAVLLAGAVVAVTACGEDKPAAQKPQPIEQADSHCRLPSSNPQLPPSVREAVLKPFTGDLDEIVKRRAVRIGVTFNRTFYFVDRGVQRGIAYEYGQLMEERLNKRFKTGTSNKIHVIFVPLPREMLLSALVDGKVDLVAAQLPVTPELQKLVDFSDPTRTNVNQILVTGPGAPAIASIEDLSGKEVFARKLGGYYQSLLALNEKFKARGEASGDDSGGPAEPGGRRPARDGERRPDPGHRGRRLPRELLEEGLSEPHRPRQRCRSAPAAPSPSPIRKNNPQLLAGSEHVHGELRAGNGLWRPDRAAIPRQHEVREERHVRGRAQEVPGASSISFGSTATGTTWISC